MNSLEKLGYVRGKLGLIPAFGNSIGCEVNKAELGVCGEMAGSAEAVMREMLLALKDAQAVIRAHGLTMDCNTGRNSPVGLAVDEAIATCEADALNWVLLRVVAQFDGDEPESPISFAKFAEENADGMGAVELAEVFATLERGDVYRDGGGAQPGFTIRRAI